MGIAFKGTFRHTVDHKGRVSIPSSFRRMLPRKARGNFTITQGLDGCLYLYPKLEWDVLQQNLKKLPFLKASTRRFTRKFLEKAYDVEMDAQGRVKIPPKLMDIAKLEKEVLFLGVLEKIEIWNPRLYEKYMAEGDGTLEEEAEKVLFPGEKAGE